MHLPEIDKYADLDSPVHRWDPRVKLACLGVLLAAAVFSPTYPLALGALLLALGLFWLTGIPVAFAFVHLRWVLAFCAFLLVVLPLTAGGEEVVRWGPLGFSPEGLRLAGLISLRAATAAVLVFPMIGTARFHVTLKALRRLRVPRVAVQILGFAYRYIFVLFDEAGRMRTAARARLSGRAGGLRAARNAGNMVGMLLVRSFERTTGVYHAMLARGYRGEARTLEDFRLGLADLAKGAAVAWTAAMLFAAGHLT